MELTLVKTLNWGGNRAMISPRTPALIGPRRHRVRAQRRVHFSYTFFLQRLQVFAAAFTH